MWEILFDAIVAFIIVILLALLLECSLDEKLLLFARLLSFLLLLLAFSSLSSSLLNNALLTAHFAKTLIKISLCRAFLLKVHASQFLFKFVDHIVISEQIDLLSQLRVFFDVLNEHIIVLLVTLSSILNLTALVLLVLLIASVLLKMLKFPQSVLLSLTELGICLLDEHNRGHECLFVIIHVIQLHQVDGIQIISEYGIVIVENLSQMCVDYECAVVVPEVCYSCDFYLNHLESMLGGSA